MSTRAVSFRSKNLRSGQNVLERKCRFLRWWHFDILVGSVREHGPHFAQVGLAGKDDADREAWIALGAFDLVEADERHVGLIGSGVNENARVDVEDAPPASADVVGAACVAVCAAAALSSGFNVSAGFTESATGARVAVAFCAASAGFLTFAPSLTCTRRDDGVACGVGTTSILVA